jgi:hypothetical protein
MATPLSETEPNLYSRSYATHMQHFMILKLLQVEIFQCVKDPETSKWTALYVGKYNVLLGRKAIVADHFVGYFYSRIIFPE